MLKWLLLYLVGTKASAEAVNGSLDLYLHLSGCRIKEVHVGHVLGRSIGYCGSVHPLPTFSPAPKRLAASQW